MINSRGCADCRSQWEYTSKSDNSSPMVSLDAMMMSCTMDAKENRYMVVANIPVAFLNTDMEEEVHMLLKGKITE